MTFTVDYFKKWTKYVLGALNDAKLRKLELKDYKFNSALFTYLTPYFDLSGSAELQLMTCTF